MDLNEFLEIVNSGEEISCKSDVQKYMTMLSANARKITSQINNGYHTDEEITELMSNLVGDLGENFRLFPPIYSDCGKNLHIGDNVFINSGCCFQDQGGVYLSDKVFVGHQVVFATLNHKENPEKRGNTIPKPIHIGKGVWIGSHSTILGGVTVGDNAIIGAGAVVTHNVPENAVVVGVPAKVIKYIDK